MRKILLVCLILILTNCKSGIISTEEKKGNINIEEFDIKNWNNEYKGFINPKGKGSSVFLLSDSSQIYPNSGKNYWEMTILMPKPCFYFIYKKYYDSNNKIKVRGKYFGDLKFGNSDLKIGIWYEFDESGTVIKQTDEDKKFGAFSYNEVLKFLNKENQINVHTGKNRENIDIKFYNSEKFNQKLWHVYVKIGVPQDESNLDSINGAVTVQKGKQYFLDGITGEVILRKNLIKYKDIIPNFDTNYPDLK